MKHAISPSLEFPWDFFSNILTEEAKHSTTGASTSTKVHAVALPLTY
jgi:hypothetical protein